MEISALSEWGPNCKKTRLSEHSNSSGVELDLPVYELKKANYCQLEGEINRRVEGLVSQCSSQPHSGGLLSQVALGLQDICHPLLLWLCELLFSPCQDLASRSSHRQTFIQAVFTPAWFKPGSIHTHPLHNPTAEPTLRVKWTATSSGTNVRWLFTAGSMEFTLQSKE